MTDEQTAAAKILNQIIGSLTRTEGIEVIVRALQAAREEGRKSATPTFHNVEEFYRETTSDGK